MTKPLSGYNRFLQAKIQEGMSMTDAFAEFEKITLRSQQSGLMSSRSLLQMKRNAFIINTSRGPIIDQGALLDGLKEVFISSTWTLAYRELRALAGLKAEALPEPAAKKK